MGQSAPWGQRKARTYTTSARYFTQNQRINEMPAIDSLFVAVSADIGRAQLATSGGRRLVFASLFSPRREKMIHARQKRIATIRVFGFASMAARVAGGTDRFGPNVLRSGVLPVIGDV